MHSVHRHEIHFTGVSTTACVAKSLKILLTSIPFREMPTNFHQDVIASYWRYAMYLQ